MKRAIAFTRVSTTKQDEGERQLIQIRKYCNDKGYQLLEDKSIKEVISGVSDEREGLEKLKDLTTADADIIIVSEASRLTRKNEDDFMDLYTIVKSIQKTGLDLFILGSGTEYAADKKLSLIDVIILVIEADRNARERETLKSRTKTGKEKVVERGGHIGHNMPYGYRNNGNATNYFSIVEDEAAIVRLMFSMVGIEGLSSNQTAIKLFRTHGTTWNSRSVLAKLRNPAYKGEFSIMGKTIAVPAIVEPELFDLVQIKISDNHLFSNKGKVHYNALKGLMKCACGCSAYITNAGTSKGVTYFTYKCVSKNSAYVQKEPCTNRAINVGLLNNIVWSITKHYINVDDFKKKTEQQKQLIIAECRGIGKMISTLQTEKIDLDSRVKNTLDTITRTSNSRVQVMLEKQLSELIDEQERTERKVDYLNKELTKLQNKVKDLAFSLLPSQLSNATPEEKREIYLKYIERVTYYSVSLNKGFVVIKFKVGTESIVMASSRPSYEGFYLSPLMKPYKPVTVDSMNKALQSLKNSNVDIATTANKLFNIDVNKPIIIANPYSFNPEKRTIIETVAGCQIEQTYDEFFKSHNMEDFKLSFD